MSAPRSRPSRSREPRAVPAWIVLLATCLGALAIAIAGPEASAQQPGDSTDADAGSPDANGEATPPPETTAPAETPPAQGPAHAPVAHKSGLYPMPGDAEVPIAYMPPGTAASPVPSDEVFPPQTLTLRFNHKKHVQELKQTCKSCHAAAYKSQSANDRLFPAPQAGVGGKVAPTVIPNPNLRFPHDKHLQRNIDCGQCHGQIDKLEMATRDHLPRMAGCFACHNMSGAAQGDAKSACSVCHLTQPDGRLTTSFSTGDLVPPRWLHNAGHSADWIERHKQVAADDSAFCGSCHTSQYCTDCHDGKVRPRKVHPNDWLSMHPQAARQDNPRCVSCHQQQTFCADCHRRTGVARDVASGNRTVGRRFHPPPAEWTNAPRGAKHHAWEAERNLNACVSCHTERDCATCHATKGLSGGHGVNPHPLGFENKCRTAFARNPRPCLVCHQSGDQQLRACQ
ncbi:MAG: cytochrome c family protein [Polyangiaceae bacterium]|nr:cytochrome c family protein [Polyangiaceae bacterium]